jgi:hypothetical protein
MQSKIGFQNFDLSLYLIRNYSKTKSEERRKSRTQEVPVRGLLPNNFYKRTND